MEKKPYFFQLKDLDIRPSTLKYIKNFRPWPSEGFIALARNPLLLVRNYDYKWRDDLAEALKKKGYKFAYTPQTNQLFPIMDNEKITELRKEFAFHTFGTVDDTHSIVRFVTSFMTTKENTEKLVNSL